MAEARQLWDQLQRLRQPYLDRAERCSALTLPYVIPPEGFTRGEDLPDPFQSVGADGVTNLASRLLLGLFPVDTPFFQLEPEPNAFEEIARDSEEAAGQVTEALARATRLINSEIEQSGTRPALWQTLVHGLISGNAVLHLPEEGSPQVFGLDRFVVRRDNQDNILDLILASRPPTAGDQGEAEFRPMIYTWIHRNGDGTYSVTQEDHTGNRVGQSKRTFTMDRLPYVVLRLNRIAGEDYGRGFVENHLGDLQSLEGLSQSLVEGVAASVQIRYLVRRGSQVNLQELNASPNGSFHYGNADDISPIETNKVADLRVAQETIAQLTNRLEAGFLTANAARRDAERVTAFEVQAVVRELEGALGGTYSNLTDELQLPLVALFRTRLEEQDRLPGLEEAGVQARAITGVEALGRSQELGRIQTAVGIIQQALGPEVAASTLKLGGFVAKVYAAAGVESTGLVKTQEEIQQEQAAARAQSLAERAVPNVATQFGEALRDNPGAAQALTQ